jgi:hypothetical protein
MLLPFGMAGLSGGHQPAARVSWLAKEHQLRQIKKMRLKR